MSVTNISSREELTSLLGQGRPVVVDFSAPAWCRPCIQFYPHFEAVSDRLNAEVKFAMVDVDTADTDLLQSFNVAGVPTVLMLEDGKDPITITSRTAIKLMPEITSHL